MPKFRYGRTQVPGTAVCRMLVMPARLLAWLEHQCSAASHAVISEYLSVSTKFSRIRKAQSHTSGNQHPRERAACLPARRPIALRSSLHARRAALHSLAAHHGSTHAAQRIGELIAGG